MKLIPVLALTFSLSIIYSGAPQKRTIVIDFDKTADGKPVDVSRTGQLIANDYLEAFGVSLTDKTPGTKVVIYDLRRAYEGQGITATSGHNALAHVGSNDPVSFTMTFKIPLQAVSFSRPPLMAGPTGVTFPEWKATALDSNGHQIGQPAGEPVGGYYSDAPAKTFILKGPGIKAVRFDSNNHQFAAFNAAIIDDLTLIE
jgi:hypothetical protein